jgi:hypothetical protein
MLNRKDSNYQRDIKCMKGAAKHYSILHVLSAIPALERGQPLDRPPNDRGDDPQLFHQLFKLLQIQ